MLASTMENSMSLEQNGPEGQSQDGHVISAPAALEHVPREALTQEKSGMGSASCIVHSLQHISLVFLSVFTM